MRQRVFSILTGSIATLIFGLCFTGMFNLSSPAQGSPYRLVGLMTAVIVGGGIGLIASLLGSHNLVYIAVSAVIGWMTGLILVTIAATLLLYRSNLMSPGIVSFVIFVSAMVVCGILVGSFPSFLVWAWKQKK